MKQPGRQTTQITVRNCQQHHNNTTPSQPKNHSNNTALGHFCHGQKWPISQHKLNNKHKELHHTQKTNHGEKLPPTPHRNHTITTQSHYQHHCVWTFLHGQKWPISQTTKTQNKKK